MLSSAFRRRIYNVYNTSPSGLKSILSHAAGIIPSKYIYGKQFLNTRNLLKKMEYRSKSDLDSFQLDELRKILVHAFQTTPFYQKEMMAKSITQEAIGDDPKGILEQLNFTNKRMLSDRLHEFLSSKKRTISHDYVSTGGTSGEPFYFYINSDRSAKEWAFIVDQWSRVGFSLNSKRVVFRGSKINAKGWEEDWITRERKFSSFEMTDEYLEKIWPILHEFKPDFIYAYPSTALGLCKFIESHKTSLPQTVKAFLLGSENIYDGQREYIENVTRKKVFLWYGHSEKLVLAGECEKTQYYHAYPQYGYVEFINEKGEEAKSGEPAEIVGTGFFNTVMPFIRYRTGDYCTYIGEQCPECSRNYPIFSNIKGRWKQEILYGFKGNEVCMSAINLHSNAMKNVFRFQFCQNEPGRTTLKIMPKDGFSHEDTKIIEKEFNEKFAGNIKVQAKIVENIPLTKMGKYKFIDQQIDREKFLSST